MSINIDKTKAQDALDILLAQYNAFGFRNADPNCVMSFEDPYILVTVPADLSRYPAINSTHPCQKRIRARSKAYFSHINGELYPLFGEPSYIGNADEFAGFQYTGGQYKATTKTGGVATNTVLADQDWTVVHEFQMDFNGQVEAYSCKFYVDTVEKANHSTHISTDAPKIWAVEYGGTHTAVRTMYMDAAFGIKLERFW